jgi:hypothetical protein
VVSWENFHVVLSDIRLDTGYTGGYDFLMSGQRRDNPKTGSARGQKEKQTPGTFAELVAYQDAVKQAPSGLAELLRGYENATQMIFETASTRAILRAAELTGKQPRRRAEVLKLLRKEIINLSQERLALLAEYEETHKSRGFGQVRFGSDLLARLKGASPETKVQLVLAPAVSVVSCIFLFLVHGPTFLPVIVTLCSSAIFVVGAVFLVRKFRSGELI